MTIDRLWTSGIARLGAILFLAGVGCSKSPPPPSSSAPATTAAAAQPQPSTASSAAAAAPTSDQDNAEGEEKYEPPTAVAQARFTGDFDGLVQRRVIRVL